MATSDQTTTRDGLVLQLMRDIATAENKSLTRADRAYTLGLLRDILAVLGGSPAGTGAPVDSADVAVDDPVVTRRRIKAIVKRLP